MVLLAAAAPEPYTGPCSWAEVLAEFDVADRAELAERIPGLGISPEITDYPDPIMVNGEPAGLGVGPLRVVVVKCVRGEQIATTGLMTVRRSAVHNVVSIRTAAGDSWLYSDVSFGGLTAGEAR